MVRQVQAPLSLPAVLPHGALQEVDGIDSLAELYKSTDDNYTGLTARTVTILRGLLGEEGVAKGDKEAKWQDGPKFVWRNVATPPSLGHDQVHTCLENMPSHNGVAPHSPG